ncbi:MAG: hypothetical protein JWP61_699 [Friedmanniella sp.]|nr:hypothetical protein [Friedmanniella sp.]
MALILPLHRSNDDRVVAGLCGALAARWRVDPVLVRVGWALLALSGGIGIVLYAAGWVLLPREGSDQTLVDTYGGPARRWSRGVWLTVVVLVSLLTGAALGELTPFSAGPALVLAGLWYLLFYRRGRGRARTADALAAYAAPAAADPTPTWPTLPSSSPAGPVDPPSPVDPVDTHRAAYLSEPDPAGLYVEAPPAPPVRRSQTPSARRLRLVGLTAVGLVLAGLAALDRSGVGVPATAYAAAALLVVGLTLVAATWLGRARGILPVGLLLALVVTGGAVAGQVGSASSWSSATRAYAVAADLPGPGDQQQAGELNVDLQALQLTGDTTYQAHVGTGSLTVRVPVETPVRVQYHVGAGVVTAFETVVGGTDLHDVTSSDPDPQGPSRPTLTLDLSVGQGVIAVTR